LLTLRDGRRATIRDLVFIDKEALVRFYSGLSEEVLRWALPPYDRARVERFFADPDHLVGLVAEFESEVVGHLHIFVYPSRMNHLGELIIYLRQDYTNVALGTEMVRTALSLASEKGLHRVQLSVIEGNRGAIRVYEKAGFKTEGMRKDAYKGADGRYYDSVEMAAIL